MQLKKIYGKIVLRDKVSLVQDFSKNKGFPQDVFPHTFLKCPCKYDFMLTYTKLNQRLKAREFPMSM